MADFTEKDIQELLSNRDNALASAIAAYAMRPQKTSTISNSSSTTTPYAISDLLRARDTIGRSTAKLNEALKPRETYLYSLANALSAMPQQQGPGSWLSALGRGFGLGAAARTNAAVDRAQKVYEAEMQDLANRLAYDKAMGEKQTQYQRQDMGYTEMPYGGSGKGGKQESVEQIRDFDFSTPEFPEERKEWGEREIQAVGRIDPNLGVRTPVGAAFNVLANAYNPEGKSALRNNNDAYAKRFTEERIAQIAKAAGGGRGIDTMPEVNLKGGPEISAMNMNSKEFEKAVQDQAWSAADKIIKANPNAQITREELANAFINDFNHGVRKENRIVKPIPANNQQRKNVVSRYTNKPVSNTISVGEVRNGYRFKGGNPNVKENWEVVK